MRKKIPDKISSLGLESPGFKMASLSNPSMMMMITWIPQ
jgi:hypothetical protein